MKSYKTLLIFIFINFMFLPIARSEPAISVEKTYYSVEGLSGSEIRTNINRNTPVQENGKNYDANTQWNVSWNFWWVQDVSGWCKIDRVTTTVDIKYLLPQLQSIHDIENLLKMKWERYYSALLQHEKGHGDLGIKAAQKIESAILAMGVRPTCDELEREANRMGHRIVKEFSDLDDQYDVQTQHGRNIGAVFP